MDACSYPDDWKWTQSIRLVRRMLLQPLMKQHVPPPIDFDMNVETNKHRNQNHTLMEEQATTTSNSSASSASLHFSQHSEALSSSNKDANNCTSDINTLLDFSIMFCLIGLALAEIFHWKTAFLLYILFRLLNSDYGKRALRTVPRDLSGLLLLIRVKLDMNSAFRTNQPIHLHFLSVVKRHPHKKCLIEVNSGRSMTFAEFNSHANKYANLFKTFDYKKDDVLALFMENGIEFFSAWLGLSKLGVITAWINTNLKLEPLSHSIKVSHCNAVMTTPTLLPILMQAVEQGLLKSDLKIFVAHDNEQIDERLAVNKLQNGSTNDTKIVHPLIDSTEPKPPQTLNFQSVLCYIYTSGTTGNPKAAIIKHYRYYLMGLACGHAFGIKPNDRLYIMMPMYHSAGGILGASQVLIRGCSACIRTKFSARNFWTDCKKYECTVSQYIGEICRYLLTQPRSSEEKEHRVRMMYGNGLRPQIWREFVRRFGIKRIGEVYGSTEGNSNLINVDNHTGSCGFIPIYKFLHLLYPIRLLKVNPETGELLRDANGFYIKCDPGDTGEVVASIRNDDPILRFEGYVDGGDTKKKIIKDCLHPGDTVFTSGDILYWDRLGYLYFKDRRGDTYRWRGENVSTMEVEGVLQPIENILDATVYGVSVPGREGKAGMIGIALVPGTNIEEFIQQCSARLANQLASYAIPVFLRICDQVDKTGTFKLKKTLLQRDGYDFHNCAGNPLFYWDSSIQTYALLTEEIQRKIDSGEYTKI